MRSHATACFRLRFDQLGPTYRQGIWPSGLGRQTQVLVERTAQVGAPQVSYALPLPVRTLGNSKLTLVTIGTLGPAWASALAWYVPPRFNMGMYGACRLGGLSGCCVRLLATFLTRSGLNEALGIP
jgi:hypothetical protein